MIKKEQKNKPPCGFIEYLLRFLLTVVFIIDIKDQNIKGLGKGILETTAQCVIKLDRWPLKNPRRVKTLVIELKVGIK